MARRKLAGTLTEEEHEEAIINGHKAEESLEEMYHRFRERLGARHWLTMKAERSLRSVNEFRHKLSNLGF